MEWFHRRSIKQKLILLFTLTSAVVLLITCTAFIAYDLSDYRSTMRREAATVAEMLADSSAAALTFDDQRSASESLNPLRAETRIELGCLYGHSQRLLASYKSQDASGACPPAPSQQKVWFTADHLMVTQPVIMAGDRVGMVFLQLSLSELHQRLRSSIMAGRNVMFVAVLIAVLLGWFLQRVISRPILHLTEVAAQVSEASDYSLRAKKLASDEMGDLIVRFNGMMDQIQYRDRELKRAQDGLEMRVEVRTSELQLEIAERKRIERDLVNAKEAAEESNRAKSAFLANMSHELRTPLNAIIGYSEMLREDSEERRDETAVSDLKKIEKAGRHLLSLINDVLDLSKIEAGRMQLNIEPVDVESLIRDVTSTIEPLARKNGNQLTVRSGYQGTIELDALKFRQSLLNLLSNACKFTQNGTVQLEVEQTAFPSPSWLEWRVRDTGIGIADQDMSKLFQSFSQVDSSTTRKFGGTGLGLAISQRLCEMMGGQISAKSELGKGSEFTIRMPL